jgi:hypothetical protein
MVAGQSDFKARFGWQCGLFDDSSGKELASSTSAVRGGERGHYDPHTQTPTYE